MSASRAFPEVFGVVGAEAMVLDVHAVLGAEEAVTVDAPLPRVAAAHDTRTERRGLEGEHGAAHHCRDLLVVADALPRYLGTLPSRWIAHRGQRYRAECADRKRRGQRLFRTSEPALDPPEPSW